MTICTTGEYLLQEATSAGIPGRIKIDDIQTRVFKYASGQTDRYAGRKTSHTDRGRRNDHFM